MIPYTYYNSLDVSGTVSVLLFSNQGSQIWSAGTMRFFLFQIFFGLSIVNSPVLMPTLKNLSILTVSDIIFLM